MFYLLLVIFVYFNLSQTNSVTSYSRIVRQASNGNSCTTPDNKPGTCTALESCPYLHQLLRNEAYINQTVTDFLRKSQCNDDDAVHPVCCTTPTMTLRPSDDSCGKSERNTKLRIVNGNHSSVGDWPWMVALGYNISSDGRKLHFKCGASLISNQWLITAAHCLEKSTMSNLTTARLGDLDLNPSVDDHATPVDEPIKDFIPHPNYTSANGPSPNDIALLRLKNTIKYTRYISPICLMSGADEPPLDSTSYVLGWGADQWRGASTSRLREATVRIHNQTECVKKYAQDERTLKIIDQRSVICAGGDVTDSCQGDSGGPLIFSVTPDKNGETRYFLGGIVSFGIKCGNSVPGVYTKVAAFTNWISETTGLPL